MLESEIRFRLRWNEKIVGYSRLIQKSVFYSKDQYAWSGNEIEFNLKDRFLDIFDINRRAIYANDIIEFTAPREEPYAVVLYDDILETFQLITPDGDTILTQNVTAYLQENRFVWKSYLFIQNRM